MKSVKIRNIIASDNKTIASIIRSVLTELSCNMKGTAYYDKETDAMFEAYQNENTIYFIAEINNEVVGGCGIGILENNICELQKMYILPKARGYKIGFQLLQKCIEFAKNKGFESIYLETFPQMKSAISLYKKNGFYKISNSLGNTCHYSCNYWMLKPLNREILSLKNEFITSLTNIYSKEEATSFFYLLAEKFLTLNRVEIALNPQKVIHEKELNLFYNAITKLKKQTPIQYIIGETEFYHLLFKVNKHVLIPRPETEELVDWIINDTKDKLNKLHILDIGTGSGCIAISLAKHLNAQVTALDISFDALQTTKSNAKRNQVSITTIQKDILIQQNTILAEKQDIIVSNPPYVRELEKEQMQHNVLQYEPHLALFVKNENPLLFYDAIASFAKINLKPRGKLYFEINEFFGKETVKLLDKKGFQNIILKKDIYGKDRMIRCERAN